MKKTLLNRNLIIRCEITRESTQRSLAFHDESTIITKENKLEFMLYNNVSFVPSPASIYNLLFFTKLTQILFLQLSDDSLYAKD